MTLYVKNISGDLTSLSVFWFSLKTGDDDIFYF